MNTTHPHLLMAQNRAHWQHLQKQAAQDRLLNQIRKENHKTANGLKNNDLPTDQNLMTWRRHWQQLLVGIGLMAALLLMRS